MMVISTCNKSSGKKEVPTSRLIDFVDRQMSLRFNLNVNGGYSVCSLFISTIIIGGGFY
mgnify:CR=1 FL=1